MIKYRLSCKKCNNIFDSWFASSKEYEKLKNLKHLSCHFCNSRRVEKTLMSPRISSNYDKSAKKIEYKKNNKIKNKIREYQKFIKKNFNYVGSNFVSEARSLHYNTPKKNKGIYGNANIEEISELKEEGIETEVIPWFRENDN